MKIVQDERGQMIAVFALGFALFCGILGFSIDAGNMYWQKSRLQAGLDAACLAGASALPEDTGEAKERLKDCAIENGIIVEETGVTDPELLESNIETPTNMKIRAWATRPVKLMFMPLLGFNNEANVSAWSAAAPAQSPVFNYAVFSGSTEETVELGLGGNLVVEGSTWSNSKSNVFGNVTITGSANATGPISGNAVATNGNYPNQGTVLPMPSNDPFQQKVYTQASAAAGHVFGTPATPTSTSFVGGANEASAVALSGAYFVYGSISEISGYFTVTGPTTILATNSIGIPKKPGLFTASGSTGKLLLCAMQGDINANAQTQIHASMYAPTGAVKLNGGADVYGNIVCLTGGKINGTFTVHGDSGLDTGIYTTIRLVAY